MPFHIPLVETVLSHGGSHELGCVLNRLGACTSLETAKRLSTMVVHERICRGIVPELTGNTQTLITIDNIDIQQSHAALDATRSWQGTSIQCIQPMPKSLQEDPVKPVQARKHPLTSPVVSPSKIALAKCRCRTLTEYQSPHGCETINREGEDKDLASLDYPIPTAHTHIVSLHHFTVTWADTFSLRTVSNVSCFRQCFLKQHDESRRVAGLPSLSALLCALHCGPREKEESRIVYVDIRSERADYKETIGTVLGNLYNTFVKPSLKKWLLLVGDAKTFDLLHAIKAE